ncbi:MAG: helix-turn-helix domain-containing protein [Kordiimonadaceae bacterium]|nr:helix-turn-helix domain-containing protein [Kordiimonadaceae bacterium]
MHHTKTMEISEVAKVSGLSASALRFYEEKGLIQSIGRRGLRRVFDGNILDRLSLIGLGQTAGFSLEEIARMFARPGKLQLDRNELSAKADEIDHTIGKLMALRDGLRHTVNCPASNHFECPTFQRVVKTIGKRSLRRHGHKKTPSFKKI